MAKARAPKPKIENGVELSAEGASARKAPRKRTSKQTTSDNRQSVPRLNVEEKWVSAKKIKQKYTEWLLTDRITKGNITLVDARKEMGKSTIFGMLAAKYSHGLDLLGEPLPYKTGKILWVTHEEGYANKVVPRFTQFGGDLNKLICPTDYRWLNELRIPSCIDKLADFVKEHGIGLIILDPFTALKDAVLSSSNTDQMRHYLECVFHAVCDLDCTVVAARHLTKNRKGDALDQGVGSTQIAAVARTVIRLDHNPLDRETRLLWVVATNEGEKPLKLQYSITSIGKPFPLLTFHGEVDIDNDEIMEGSKEIGEVDEKNDADMILAGILKDGPKWSKEVIAEGKAAGVSERTLRSAKARMKSMSQRRQMADGGEWRVYWLPPNDATGS